MEREEPSEQPCREGEAMRPPPPATVGMLTILVNSTFQMLVDVQEALVLPMSFNSTFSMTAATVPSEVDAEMNLGISTIASMQIDSGACVASDVESDLIAPDFSSWIHEDASVYYPLGLFGGSYENNSISANRLTAIAYLVTKSLTIRSVGLLVTSGSVGNGKIGIYRALSTTNPFPGALVVDCAVSNGSDMDVSTTGFKTLTVGVTLTPGVYWFATFFSSGTQPGIKFHGSFNHTSLILGANATAGRFNTCVGIHATGLSYPSGINPLPDPFPTTNVFEDYNNGPNNSGTFVSFGS